MAAIAGVAGSPPEPSLAEKMLQTVAHRGPDHLRLHRDGRIDAGVRASQLSSARGDGLARADGVTVLFDGEIYNDRAPGESDASVALELYRKYGRTFASHLEGVFACAACDGESVLLARDAVGVRPMYWGTTGNGEMCFASEMKALVGVSEDVAELPPGTSYSGRT